MDDFATQLGERLRHIQNNGASGGMYWSALGYPAQGVRCFCEGPDASLLSSRLEQPAFVAVTCFFSTRHAFTTLLSSLLARCGMPSDGQAVRVNASVYAERHAEDYDDCTAVFVFGLDQAGMDPAKVIAKVFDDGFPRGQRDHPWFRVAEVMTAEQYREWCRLWRSQLFFSCRQFQLYFSA
jgi:hypothetical protein